MDSSRFDALARSVAARGSRRTVVGGFVAVALTALVPRGATAANCRTPGAVCREHANCCSHLCGEKDRTGRRRCVCPDPTEPCAHACVDPATAYLSDPDNCGACRHRCPSAPCHRPICVAGVCGLAPDPARAGDRCDDGDPCTQDDACQEDSTCRGTPKDCSALDDQCNLGTCRTFDGVCFTQPRAGAPCAPGGDACKVGNCDIFGRCLTFGQVNCPICQACSGGSCQPVDSDPNCPSPASCGGGGTPGECFCSLDDGDVCAEVVCGLVTNGCGRTIECANCPYPRFCHTELGGACLCTGGQPDCGGNADCVARGGAHIICQDNCCCTPNGPSQVPDVVYGCFPPNPNASCCSGYCDPATNLCAPPP